MDEDFERLMAKLKADLDRPTIANKVFWRSERLEKAFITGDVASIRTIHRTVLVGTLVVLGIWIAYPILLGHGPWWFTTLLGVPMLYFAFTGVTTSRWRAASYRSGYLAGRQQVYDAIREGQKQGVDPDETVLIEQMRDFQVGF